MKVYYDFQILSLQKYGGISRYFLELVTRLRALGAEADIDCIHSRNYYFKDYIKPYDESKHNNIINKIDLRVCRQLNKLRALRDMRKDYDIIHPTFYSNYMIGHHTGKLVVTVHDMINERFHDNPTVIDLKKRMIHAADHIIVISESTKRDLLEIYPDISPKKISLIYQGNTIEIPPENITVKNPIGKRYVLFVGGRGWYKNFMRFVKAMHPILEAQPDLYVFCVGGGGALSAEEREAVGSMIDRYIFAALDDNSLVNAYANAECFVFPSTYEGFGLPVLESFACNCPLVCSNVTSLPEIAGDAAEYFDPTDVDDMSAKILRVLDDESLRERMRISGRERAKLFTWDKTAKKTLECYMKVAGR